MVSIFFRYLAMVILLKGLHKWDVRWNKGAPTANAGETFIFFQGGQWLVKKIEDEDKYESVTRHSSLIDALDGFWTRLNDCKRPYYYVLRQLQSMLGAINLRVLLYLLKDGSVWECSVWAGCTHKETTYCNASGWIVKHFSSGGIQAANRETGARLAYSSAGWTGSWFVSSGFSRRKEQKYTMGMNVTWLFNAFGYI